ncbi:MAG: DUF4065 domain-containing protein [Alphaproteobacteria bacterium]|nr:DUF4065 domain-containing protein [Alphaproteobacteria bacterium]
MTTLTANQVADYILIRLGKEGGVPVTDLKLQKLLYYCQGWHLAAFGRPLFRDTINAWKHGTAVRSVWDRFKCLGKAPIPPDLADATVIDHIPLASRRVIDDTLEELGQVSAWVLADMTHLEPAWLEARCGHPSRTPNAPLNTNTILDSFAEKARRRIEECDDSETAKDPDIETWAIQAAKRHGLCCSEATNSE